MLEDGTFVEKRIPIQLPPPSGGRCDDCKHFRWYYEHCDKWDCQIDDRSVHNCWEMREVRR